MKTGSKRSKLMLAAALIACIAAGGLAGRWYAQRDAPPAPGYTQVDNSRYLRAATAEVVLYTQDGCAGSPRVKAWLEQAGVSYEERIVERSNPHWHDIQAMGVRLMPVLLTPQARIEGFDPAVLAALVQRDPG
ncbi:hypothetical protein H0E84_04780 [Luteimonas sp. SJ-92]|uniref:Glutaredoxin domain-containing protein n=1 Tax=Luteimonas salinisoli TaxID=2752307 RepID=A0A853JAJ5_9GAMM|nr:glutaredoxin domain-containing protein [Luteimonas salinisoli]NZA25689.1 hypothetical protein [Luteimonas salinisoli]